MAKGGLARRWANVSLRAKITGVTVFILTLGLFVAGAGTLSFLKPQLIAQQDATLQQLQVDPAPALAEGADTRSLDRDDVLFAPNTFYIAVLDTDGNVLYDNYRGVNQPSAPLVPIISAERAAELEDSTLVLRDDESADTTWRAVLTPITSADIPDMVTGTMLIASSTANIDNIMARYITIFTGFGAAVVLLGAALTRLLVTNTFEPLIEVEQTASEIANGDFAQRIHVASENTEVGRLGTSLNTMLDRVDDAVKERDRTIAQMRRFVGDASHELRTPLVSVRGYAELYRMGGLPGDAEVAQAMERIEKEAIRMGTLVEDLLALARLDERKPLELGPVNVLPLARDAALDAMVQFPSRTVSVVAAGEEAGSTQPNTVVAGPAAEGGGKLSAAERKARAQAEAADLRSANPSWGAIALAGATLARIRSLAGRLTPGSGKDAARDQQSALAALSDDDAVRLKCQPIAWAAENRVRQILNNLIGNAVRYTPDETPIEIVVTPRPFQRVVRIEVVDHGDGIPEQVRTKIFERFWRADTSRNRETGGSGLGLAIVASIVDALDGTVTVRETPGGGATFRVELPLANEAFADPSLIADADIPSR